MQPEALTNELLELRVHQSQEQQALITRLEAQANARVGPETPDDCAIGSANRYRCSMTVNVKLAN